MVLIGGIVLGAMITGGAVASEFGGEHRCYDGEHGSYEATEPGGNDVKRSGPRDSTGPRDGADPQDGADLRDGADPDAPSAVPVSAPPW